MIEPFAMWEHPAGIGLGGPLAVAPEPELARFEERGSQLSLSAR
ncbi:hypothetical protein ACWGSK_03455 [Nocardiopsis sp. NPDC055551]